MFVSELLQVRLYSRHCIALRARNWQRPDPPFVRGARPPQALSCRVLTAHASQAITATTTTASTTTATATATPSRPPLSPQERRMACGWEWGEFVIPQGLPAAGTSRPAE